MKKKKNFLNLRLNCRIANNTVIGSGRICKLNYLRYKWRNLRLQWSQEAGSLFINEIKNIVITVVVATSVVQGSLTLSFLCLIRIEQEQPSSNICSFYKRNIDERWILYSPQRLILPIQGNVHWLAVNISDINPVTFGNAVSYRCPAI